MIARRSTAIVFVDQVFQIKTVNDAVECSDRMIGLDEFVERWRNQQQLILIGSLEDHPAM